MSDNIIDIERIQNFILSNNINEKIFCVIAGIKPGTVSRLAGKDYNVTLDDVEKIAKVMNLDIKELFTNI